MLRIRPPGGYTKEDTRKRKEWLAERTSFKLNDAAPDEPESLKGIIENHIGYMPIPMAVAGPLRITGTYVKGEYYVPLCTLEGTLSMSMTRGFYLTHQSNGIRTQHIKQELSRSPIFIFGDFDVREAFSKWITGNYDQIKSVAEATTQHGKLLRIDQYPTQNSVILDFVYYTAEAAGQNMTTFATYAACRYIRESFASGYGADFKYFIESNFNADKNPTHRALVHGRGHHVIASALVKGKLLRRILRCTAQEMVEGWGQASPGFQMAGVLGNNMHVANALAALYLATGQDAACVAENSIGIVSYELRNDEDLLMLLTMPSITVGTVGGGTRLKHQRANLEMLGCTGRDSSKKLAEIICASALALELSLAGAIGNDEFAQSHADYGRS
jgi:hydroxymethylglutaryl-CoA reductase (NADPH)